MSSHGSFKLYTTPWEPLGQPGQDYPEFVREFPLKILEVDILLRQIGTTKEYRIGACGGLYGSHWITEKSHHGKVVHFNIETHGLPAFNSRRRDYGDPKLEEWEVRFDVIGRVV